MQEASTYLCLHGSQIPAGQLSTPCVLEHPDINIFLHSFSTKTYAVPLWVFPVQRCALAEAEEEVQTQNYRERH